MINITQREDALLLEAIRNNDGVVPYGLTSDEYAMLAQELFNYIENTGKACTCSTNNYSTITELKPRRDYTGEYYEKTQNRMDDLYKEIREE